MGRAGAIELVRRLAALALLVAAVTAWFAGRGPIACGATALLGLFVYFGIPRPVLPAGARGHELMPSVHMPDLLGFLVGVPLFSLSFIVIALDPLLADVWPLYILFWVPASLSPAVFVIAARYATSWVRAGERTLEVSRFGRVAEIAYADIAGVAMVARRLPKWVPAALIAFGGVRGAGTALLHGGRATHTLRLELKDGGRVDIAADALPGMEEVLAALHRAGVALPPELTRDAARRIRRRRR